ncbi:hypothetical protein [Mycobacterium sp.]|uniref:hypothetical protein n=1 Tax=Mycobacterium sp. TaxID=1785 RepID=UPI003D0B6AD9
MATPGNSGAPSLGLSLMLNVGDLVFDPGTGDLDIVREQHALSQALQLAVQTQVGSDRINVGFGFDQLSVGAYAYDIHTRKEYVKMQLVKAVTGDRRVRDVREIFFRDDPRYFELHSIDALSQQQIIARARASREYTVYVVIDTISNDTLTIEAGATLG